MNTLSQKKERGVCVHVTSHKLIVSSFDITGSRSAVGKVSATDVSLTAYPGFVSSIPAWSYTFVEIDHEIISTLIILPSAESFKKGYYQLQAKVFARSTG